MELISTIIVTVSVVITTLIIFSISIKLFKKFFLFYNYKKTIDLFEYFLEKSYSLTYENSISSWISNGMSNTIPPEEKETIERNFIKQTFLIMGDNNHRIIAQFFGNDEYLINFMILFIRKKIANDGLANVIKNATMDTSAQIRS